MLAEEMQHLRAFIETDPQLTPKQLDNKLTDECQKKYFTIICKRNSLM